MKRKTFIKLFSQPGKKSSIRELESVIASFPYCQAAHILLAKNARQHGSMLAEQKFKKAAAYAADRSRLKMLISGTADIAGATDEIRIVLPEILPDLIPETEKYTPAQEVIQEKAKQAAVIRELEDNLEKLKLARRQLHDETPAENNFTSTPPEKHTSPGADTDQKIINSRLEEVLAPAESSEANPADLLLNYLEYLEEKRNAMNKKKVDEIIEKFIREDPSIPYLNSANLPEKQEDLSEKASAQPLKMPVSETYASLLVRQGKKEKAIEIYRQLSLKYPEKSAYFAARIEELKK